MCKPLSLKRRTAQTEALTGTAMYETLESLNSANHLILASQNYIMLKFGFFSSLKHSAVSGQTLNLTNNRLKNKNNNKKSPTHALHNTVCFCTCKYRGPGQNLYHCLIILACKFMQFLLCFPTDFKQFRTSTWLFPRARKFGKVPGNGRQPGSHPTETMETRGRIEVLILLSKLLELGHPAFS